MTYPTAAKLMLLEDPRGGNAGHGALPVRRFRLARLHIDAQAADAKDRFEYLRRPHD